MKKLKLKKRPAKSPQQIQKQKKQRKKIIITCLVVVALLVTSATIYLGFGIFKQVEGFSKEKLLNEESSFLVDENDNQYFSLGQGGVRKNVSYDDIPQVMIDAVVAAEDSRFFEHNGFDLPRIVKALLGNIVAGGITGGGSTITQQVIKKSYYPKEEQTIERKAGEIILAIEATSQTTKEEILELYLNKIYFGYGNKAIGIYAASRYYFDKAVQNLTLPEAALLAGTLNSPNSFDPFKNLDKAQKRRDIILDLMELHGYITAEECESTKAIPVENTLKYNPISSGGKYQAYADKVVREVYERTGYDPNDTPMKITTSINTELQEKLDDISNGIDYTYQDKNIKAGATVLEASTGRIVGVLSDRDYTPMGTSYAYAADKEKAKSDPNLRYGQRNQPGSSLKPIIAYAAAFEFLNYSTAHYVHDVPYIAGKYAPGNHDGKIHGDLSIKDALKNSWNLAAIQTYQEVITGKDAYGNSVGNGIGDAKMKSYLEGFGFDMYEEKLGPQYAIGGWSTGVSTEEEAAAYAAIANGGTYIPPHAVTKIELLSTGEVIDLEADYNSKKQKALSAESSFMIRDIMTSYVKEGGSAMYNALNLGYNIGAKSGTSNFPNDLSNKKLAGENRDGWMAAFSPDYAWSVWTGYDSKNPQVLKSNSDANKIAAIIAKTVHKGGLKNSYPSKPSGVVKASCISGIYPYVAPGDGVPSDRVVSGWFKKSNTPSGSASGASLKELASFTASLVEGKINVNFAEYDPVSMTQDATPTKKFGKYTVPYLGDINQIYGKVVYVAEVADATGKIVHSEKLSTNTATLNFTPTPGNTYTVTGYYAFESSSGTSNKLTQTVTVEGNTIGTTYSQVSLTSTTLVLQMNIPAGNSVSISINGGEAKTISTSGQVTFSSLTPATKYIITMTETTSAGQTNTLAPYEFTTPEATTPAA